LVELGEISRDIQKDVDQKLKIVFGLSRVLLSYFIIFVFYVDDFIFIGSDLKFLNYVKISFKKKF